jgi:hypothetical protein
VPQRHDNRLELQPPFRELVDSRGRRRRQLSPPYYPAAFQLAQPLDEDIRAHPRQARPEFGEALRSEQQLSWGLGMGFPRHDPLGSVVHEDVPLMLAAIHAGGWLVKLLLMAVILGVWRNGGRASK